jgi:hypothetical protein
LKLIRKHWNILNVKGPTVGNRKRDDSRNPIHDVDDENLKFLSDMADWFETWRSSGLDGFTKETFGALIRTSRALVELSMYLLSEKGFHYVLLGQLQSDPIEVRIKSCKVFL